MSDKNQLIVKVDNFIECLGDANGDVIQGVAAALGWKEEDYFDLCMYDEKDDAWYPKNGSNYSIVDHAMKYLTENGVKAICSSEQLEKLESLSSVLRSEE